MAETESINEEWTSDDTDFIKYQYKDDDCRRDLNNGVQATRIVDLLPGCPTDSLRCIIHCVKLIDKPAYTALSYAWEDRDVEDDTQEPDHEVSAVKHFIEVNRDRRLEITAELEHALIAIRDKFDVQTLWIDQLCIDQGDVAEKSVQVFQMATIYGEAELVILWTGIESFGTQVCFDTADFLARLWHEFGCLSPEHAEVSDQFIRQYPSDQSILTRDLLQYLCRRVFTRGWVVQEVALASRITVKCGQIERDWVTIAAAIHSLATIDRRRGNTPLGFGSPEQDATAPVLYMLEIREKVQAAGSISLLEGLEALQKFQTTDPRDKVFAALAMCKSDETIAKILPIDYSLSVTEVFMRATKAIIFGEKNLGTFSHAGMSSGENQEIPSWVPNWANSPTQPRSMKVARERGYDAARGFLTYNCWPASQRPPRLCPMVSLSFNFTKINLVLGRAAPKGEIGSYTSTFSSWYQASHMDDSVYGEAPKTKAAFLRTLIYPFERIWRAQPPVAGKDYDMMVVPGPDDNELREPVKHDYELDLVQIGLQNVFDLDDDTYFYDFHVLGPEGRDKPAFWTFAGGIAHQPRVLSNGDQVITLEEAANGAFVYGSDLAIMTKTLHKAFNHHVFFTTESGHFGLGPIGLCDGDEIHLIGGCDVPLVFREEADSDDITTMKRKFVSECYVHGVMDGEVIEERKWKKLDLLTIC